MIIDFHNHFFPPEYIEQVRRGPSHFQVSDDAEGNPVLHSPGDYNVAVRGHRDLEYRRGILGEHGITMQVLTLTAPGTSIEEPERAVELASLVNDALAASRSEHFTCLGTLPMNAPERALEEMRRSIQELDMRGFMLFGNASGVPLADPRFEPLYALANEQGLVLYIHPTYPLGVEAMKVYMLMPLIGFMFDTTLAAAHLVFAGIPERFPDIRWVLAHLGGAIPYLAERLDRGYRAFERCRQNLSAPPSEYLRNFYYDTVNFDPAALRLAVDFAGSEQILAGSDYPHMIGSLSGMIESIESLGLSRQEKDAILGKNCARLLGL